MCVRVVQVAPLKGYMLALFDGDILAYRCSASAENDPVEIALHRINTMIDESMVLTQSDSYKLFLGGSTNFRYDIYPEYKANRKDKPKPKHLEICREYLVTNWNGVLSDGCETDDLLGVHSGPDTVICSIDKDLRQIPGKHFNLVTKVLDTVDEWQGHFNFYSQLILGDRSDNILGYDRVMRASIPKFLQPQFDFLNGCETEQDMFEHVYSMYELANHVADIHLNGQLLYIWRKDNDSWHFHQLQQEMEQRLSSLETSNTGNDHSLGATGQEKSLFPPVGL